MRDTTAAELAALQATTYREFFRVDVQNADGTWIDYSTAGGHDWFIGGSVGQNVDQSVFDIRLTFQLENRGRGAPNGKTYSLAPLRSDSALNVDDAGAYASALDSGRGIRVYCAVLETGEPGASDWVLLIEGEIDGVDSASSDDEVAVRARGAISAELADRFIEDLTEYGSVAGVAIQTVMQAIIDDWTTSQPTLYTPSAPGFNITPTPYRGISVLEAEQGLSALIGYYVREEWDNGTGAFRLTFAEPDRAVSVADHVFTPNDYWAIEQLDIHRDRVRNVIRVSYYDASGAYQEIEVSDPTSILRYGRKFYEIPERQGSPINTSGEATTLGNAALADLKDPTMDKRVSARFFWPVMLGDYYTFEANGVHYDSDQDLAVSGFVHNIVNGGECSTELFLTGKPVAYGAFWTKRQRLRRPRPTARMPIVRASLEREDLDTAPDLTLIVDDPDHAITAVQFRKREGSQDGDVFGSFASSWDTAPSSGFHGTFIESLSVPGGEESAIEWRVTWVDEEGVTRYLGDTFYSANIDENETEVRWAAQQAKPIDDTVPHSVGSDLRNRTAGDYSYVLQVTLPVGVEITGVSANLFRADSDGVAQAQFLYRFEVADTVNAQILATLTHSSTDWETVVDNTLAEVVALARVYSFAINLDNASGAADDERLLWVGVKYVRHTQRESL